MANLNKVTVAGHLVGEPTVFTNDNGEIRRAFYTIAANRVGDGTDFIRCTSFGNAAGYAAEKFHKGTCVLVSGRLETGKYEKDGKTIYTTDTIVESQGTDQNLSLNYNSVTLLGRLTRDPDIRRKDDSVVARFTLAVSRRYKPDRKEGEQDTDFLNCVAFGRNAQFAEKFLKKGTRILADGRIQTGSYTNKNGGTVYTTDVVVNGINFAGRKQEGTPEGNPDPFEGAGDSTMPEAYEAPDDAFIPAGNDPFSGFEEDDDTLPFR